MNLALEKRTELAYAAERIRGETTCGFARRPLNLFPAPCADLMSTYPLMNLPFSLRKHGGNQRAETIKERQSGYHSVYCAKYAQFTDSVLLHRRFTLRRARHSSAAQLVSLEFTDGTCELGVWYNLSSQKLSVTTR